MEDFASRPIGVGVARRASHGWAGAGAPQNDEPELDLRQMQPGLVFGPAHPKRMLQRIGSEASALGQLHPAHQAYLSAHSHAQLDYATALAQKRDSLPLPVPVLPIPGDQQPKLSHQAVRLRLQEYVRNKMERDEYLRSRQMLGSGSGVHSVPTSTLNTPGFAMPQTPSAASSASAEREQFNLNYALLNAAFGLGVGSVSIADATAQHWLAAASASLGLACDQERMAMGMGMGGMGMTLGEPCYFAAARPAASDCAPQAASSAANGGSVDFPLRKTSSEPNLKVRSLLRKRVIERRASPFSRRTPSGRQPSGGRAAHNALLAQAPSLAVPHWSASHPLLLAFAAAQGTQNELTPVHPASNTNSGPPSSGNTPLDGANALALARLFAASQQPAPAPDESGLGSLSSSSADAAFGSHTHHPHPHFVLPLHPAEQELSQHGKIRRRHIRPLNRTNSSPLPLGFDVAALQHVIAAAAATQQSTRAPPVGVYPAAPKLTPNVNVCAPPNVTVRRADRTLLKQHLRQRVLHKFGGSLSVDSALPPAFDSPQPASSSSHAQQAHNALLNAAGAFHSRIESSDSMLSASTATAATTPSTNADDSGISISTSVSHPSHLNSMALLSMSALPQFAFEPPAPAAPASPNTSPRASAVGIAPDNAGPLLNLVHMMVSPPNVAVAAANAGTPNGASRGRFLDIASAMTNVAAFMKLPSPIQEERFGMHTTDAQSETGIGYDTQMLAHQCVCGNQRIHPEQPDRILCIYQRLRDTGLVQRCETVKSRKARLEELELCHTAAYALVYGTSKQNRHKIDPLLFEQCPFELVSLPCGGYGVDSDTYFNEEHSATAARVAVACVTDLALKIAQNELRNGFAIVRPPGHHAESASAMGHCYFNSVAIAAKQVLRQTSVRRVAIVDWDIHHGSGTQQVFYADRQVLYISMHRHDSGHFFPGTGSLNECGSGEGAGFTVNIPWCNSPSFLQPHGTVQAQAVDADAQPMSDAEYLAAFRCVVLPVLTEFDPELIIVSCGFDAALGHPDPIGGYLLTPQCFGYLTRQLMRLAHGHVLLALEGGYNLPILADCSEYCVRALLGDTIESINELEFKRRPNTAAIETIKAVVDTQQRYWPSLSSVPLCDLLYSEHEFMHKQEFINYRIAEMTASLAANALGNPNPSASASPNASRPGPSAAEQMAE